MDDRPAHHPRRRMNRHQRRTLTVELASPGELAQELGPIMVLSNIYTLPMANLSADEARALARQLLDAADAVDPGTAGVDLQVPGPGERF